MRIESNYNRSRAREIELLFSKKKELLGLKSGQDLPDFKEPVLLLMRRNRRVNFYENATAGVFKFEHSSGEDKELNLDPRFLQTFEYAGKVFQGYIANEDEAFPYPADPILHADMFSIIINKILNDQLEWKAKMEAAKGDWIMKIGMAIGIVVIVIALAYVMAPDFVKSIFKVGEPVVQQAATNTTQTIIQNVSILN